MLEQKTATYIEAAVIQVRGQKYLKVTDSLPSSLHSSSLHRVTDRVFLLLRTVNEGMVGLTVMDYPELKIKLPKRAPKDIRKYKIIEVEVSI